MALDSVWTRRKPVLFIGGCDIGTLIGGGFGGLEVWRCCLFLFSCVECQNIVPGNLGWF